MDGAGNVARRSPAAGTSCAGPNVVSDAMRLLLATALTATYAAALSPVQFAQRSGWHVGAGTVHACPGVPAARCSQVSSWAATIRWRDCAGCLPHRTLAQLPADGIAIQITLARERPPRAKATLAWLPQVHRSEVSKGFEGIQRRIGVYQRFARLGRYEAYVWVFFGRSRPTARQLTAANTELRTARLP
jgi:hypothetical protein